MGAELSPDLRTDTSAYLADRNLERSSLPLLRRFDHRRKAHPEGLQELRKGVL